MELFYSNNDTNWELECKRIDTNKEIKTFESEFSTDFTITSVKVNFSMTYEFESDCLSNLSTKQKSMMYYYILKYKANIVFYQEKEKNDSKEGERRIYYEDLEKEYPNTVSQRILMVLENFANYIGDIGEGIRVEKNKDGMEASVKVSWLFMPENDSIDGVWWMYKFLLDEGYLKIVDSSNSKNYDIVTLTEKAWNRIEMDVE